MDPRSPRRATALAVAGLTTIALLGTVLGGTALATSPLDLARHRSATLARTIQKIRRHQHRDSGHLRAIVHRTTRVLLSGPGESHADDENGRWLALRTLLLAERREALSKLRESERRSLRRLRELSRRRSATDAWIRQWGILQTCPVRGPVSIADNFGVVVRIPDVPVHIHQGNDMTAATGTPIVAPFAGTAIAAPNVMGGLAVKVYGELGYVYNAHLSAYGRLGPVGAGTVIGYVGSTGDAGGPHDHFEWHPHGGPAVDPNPYLTASCG
jgi:murein DD-endopeptidase MepM/ murein hydrolase activator NlpD